MKKKTLEGVIEALVLVHKLDRCCVNNLSDELEEAEAEVERLRTKSGDNPSYDALKQSHDYLDGRVLALRGQKSAMQERIQELEKQLEEKNDYH